MYLEFEKGSDYIKGKTDDISEINALVAKVIDNVEGNLMFHAYLFIFKDDPRSNQVPETALSYTFDQLPKHLERLKVLLDSETKQRLIDLYEYQNEYVRSIWNKFPDKLPASIREHLDNLQSTHGRTKTLYQNQGSRSYFSSI